MKQIEIFPLIGIGEIELGSAQAEVRRILGPCRSFKKTPLATHPTDSWFDNKLQVYYTGQEPIVEYIELSNGLEATLFGHSVFSTKASQLISLIEQHAAFDNTDPELGYSYIFRSLQLSFWRPGVKGSEGSYFSTVGVGIHGYFS
ncbi:hypothetical protein [Methylophilus sp. 5]|uniref:hypothetical protein n=1 Tax=Methylophilus sp. 5 TaxID=1112274 RepID=UPI0005639E28|nr:hypothetical protein [Methylophilus sp. 5]